jgi:hypothetical protein
MPKLVDLSFIDETAEDPAELLDVLPDIRYQVEAAAADDDLGIRSLLEQPAAFAHPWWRDQARRGRFTHEAPRALRAPQRA